eukprot:4901080-Amphidinium_carterae.1
MEWGMYFKNLNKTATLHGGQHSHSAGAHWTAEGEELCALHQERFGVALVPVILGTSIVKPPTPWNPLDHPNPKTIQVGNK